jgi:hypothetical protein
VNLRQCPFCQYPVSECICDGDDPGGEMPEPAVPDDDAA